MALHTSLPRVDDEGLRQVRSGIPSADLGEKSRPSQE
jgi:hypothetical protein